MILKEGNITITYYGIIEYKILKSDHDITVCITENSYFNNHVCDDPEKVNLAKKLLSVVNIHLRKDFIFPSIMNSNNYILVCFYIYCACNPSLNECPTIPRMIKYFGHIGELETNVKINDVYSILL